MLKKCNGPCGLELETTEHFNKAGKNRDGSVKYQPLCKACRKLKEYEAKKDEILAKRKKHLEENREEINQKKREAYHSNLEENREKGRKNYEEKKDVILKRQRDARAADPQRFKNYYKKHYDNNKETVIARRMTYYHNNRSTEMDKFKAYYWDNREQLLQQKKDWYHKNGGMEFKKEYNNAYKPRRSHIRKIRWRNDINYNLRCRMSNAVRQALNAGKDWKPTQEILGYTFQQLREHLQSRFTEGMTWDKFLAGEIHIDHIRPQSSFNFTSINDVEFKECWALSNLQPLWEKDNLRKSNKLTL